MSGEDRMGCWVWKYPGNKAYENGSVVIPSTKLPMRLDGRPAIALSRKQKLDFLKTPAADFRSSVDEFLEALEVIVSRGSQLDRDKFGTLKASIHESINSGGGEAKAFQWLLQAFLVGEALKEDKIQQSRGRSKRKSSVAQKIIAECEDLRVADYWSSPNKKWTFRSLVTHVVGKHFPGEEAQKVMEWNSMREYSQWLNLPEEQKGRVS